MTITARLLLVTGMLAAAVPAEAQPVGFAQIVRTVAAETRLAAPQTARSAQASQAPRARRSLRTRIVGGIVGGAGGFFAGGYLGAAIEGDRCNCDDPGLKGALIGMPIGAAVGAWAGQRWLF